MNHSDADVDTQLKNLLDVVSRNRDERCAAVLDQARQQASRIVSQAHQEARLSVHQQVLAIRERVRHKLASAEAQKQTRLRLHRHHNDRALLARAWEPLNNKLLERWQQDSTRAQWVNALISQASANLVATPWRIEHPLDWPAAEQAALQDQLLNSLGSAPLLEPTEGINAGLRICAGQACIDGTLAGLLKSRTRIDSMLLAKLNECRARLAEQPNGQSND